MFYKKLLCWLFSVTAAASLILSGCNTPKASARDIADSAIAACANLTTMKMNMTVTMDGQIPNSGSFNMTADMSGVQDIPKKQVYLTMAGNIAAAGFNQTLDMDMYMLDGAMYMKMSVLGKEQWVKMQIPQAQIENQMQLAQQLEFLKSAVNLTSLGTEKVNGVECDILQIDPDVQALTDWVLAQQQSAANLDLSKVDLSKMFKQMTLKQWIAQDTHFPVKTLMDIQFEVTPESMGAPTGTAAMTMNMKADMTFSDFGKPVTIQLPAEALNAPALSSGN